MPFANNRGIKIHYEIEGDGPPLVLHHGFTSSIERWKLLGYTDQLKKYFKLIMLDSRGHGKSEKPIDVDAYTDITPYICIAMIFGFQTTYPKSWP